MNYTLITYTESFTTFGRCGDCDTFTDSTQEIYFTQNKEDLIEAWAAAEVNIETAKNLTVLLNGVADENCMDNSDEYLHFDELLTLYLKRCGELRKIKQEKN